MTIRRGLSRHFQTITTHLRLVLLEVVIILQVVIIRWVIIIGFCSFMLLVVGKLFYHPFTFALPGVRFIYLVFICWIIISWLVIYSAIICWVNIHWHDKNIPKLIGTTGFALVFWIIMFFSLKLLLG